MGPKECWMRQSHEIWGHFGHPSRSDEGSSTCAGTKCPPPCSIGLTPPNKFTKFSFFTIKGMECISNLRLAHFVRLKLSFVEK